MTQRKIQGDDLIEGMVEERRLVGVEVERGRTVTILTKSSCCTYFIVRSIDVAHLSFPIFFLAFMANDDRETVECAWGQSSTLLGSGGYRSDQRDRRREGKL